jgi:hypothetical protein
MPGHPPAFSLDADGLKATGASALQVSLYEDDAAGAEVVDGSLIWELPDDGGGTATSPPFFIPGLASDPTRPPALSAPALEILYSPQKDGGAQVTLQITAKDTKNASRLIKVKFECKLGIAASGAKVCMGKKMSITFPVAKRAAGEPLKLQFSALAVL